MCLQLLFLLFLQISVIDEANITANMQCEAVSDPHMRLFDGRKWEGHWKEGIYILYRNKPEDAEVNLFVAMSVFTLIFSQCIVYI